MFRIIIIENTKKQYFIKQKRIFIVELIYCEAFQLFRKTIDERQFYDYGI